MIKHTTQVKTNKQSVTYWLLGLLLLMLLLQSTACGWRLRGSISFPPSIQTLYLQGVARYSELGVAIHSAFDGTNSTLVGQAGGAVAVLHILSNRADKRVLSTDGSGRASEYEIAYFFEFKITDKAGNELVRQQRVSAKREYRFDPSNVLATDSEVTRLQKEMIRVSVQNMMRRIDASLRSQSAGKLPSKSGNSTK
ncbi:MAG: LPS assembly lipoprotein LptE [Gammaproteobacteria bacterium]|nr:LPS assembly lipoprotein LptE [Gammaproteobacteria bacterium]